MMFIAWKCKLTILYPIYILCAHTDLQQTYMIYTFTRKYLRIMYIYYIYIIICAQHYRRDMLRVYHYYIHIRYIQITIIRSDTLIVQYV